MKKIIIPILSLLIISKIQSQCAGAGTINYQRWDNITGTTVASLTSNANYPNNPGSKGTRTRLQLVIQEWIFMEAMLFPVGKIHCWLHN